MRGPAILVAVAMVFALSACSESFWRVGPTPIDSSSAAAAPTPSLLPSPPPAIAAASTPLTAQPRLASNPAQLADDLVADEQALRNPSSTEAVLLAAARRQQAAYRALGRNPEWATVARSRIPPPLLGVYDDHFHARRQLDILSAGEPMSRLPTWHIVPPAPAEELLGYYRTAEGATGVAWTHLAAINLIETGLGRIRGVSTAGAQGPMQFLPSTFAAYGAGGDINSPHDSIMAAGRYLAASGFAHNRDRALWRYNNSPEYVRAVNHYAAVLAADPAAFTAFYRWDIYFHTTHGDVVLPVGYSATAPIPVEEYLATHPQ